MDALCQVVSLVHVPRSSLVWASIADGFLPVFSHQFVSMGWNHLEADSNWYDPNGQCDSVYLSYALGNLRLAFPLLFGERLCLLNCAFDCIIEMSNV